MKGISRKVEDPDVSTRALATFENENPLLDNVRPIPTLHEAMRLTEQRESTDVAGWSPQERITQGVAGAYVTDAGRATVLVNAIVQIWSSLRDRDLRSAAYRNYAIVANDLLHRSVSKGRKTFPSRFCIAPRAKPRGIMVAAPVNLGQRRLADIVASEVGSEPLVARVRTPAGISEYLQLGCVRVPWPITGGLPGFAQGFFGAFDAAFNDEYVRVTHSPLFRERDIIPAICALVVASNLGLLIVDGINVQSATVSGADNVWSALAQITRTTGVPILCLPTPGAAALSLAKLPDAVGALTTTGITEIHPYRGTGDPRWPAVCLSIFDRTVRLAGVASMPAWLIDAAYDLTLGFPGLLAKALTAIALDLVALNTNLFTPEVFIKQSTRALMLDQPHLDAIRTIRQGGNYRPSSLIRHGDWLSLSQLASTHLMPELR